MLYHEYHPVISTLAPVEGETHGVYNSGDVFSPTMQGSASIGTQPKAYHCHEHHLESRVHLDGKQMNIFLHEHHCNR